MLSAVRWYGLVSWACQHWTPTRMARRPRRDRSTPRWPRSNAHMSTPVPKRPNRGWITPPIAVVCSATPPKRLRCPTRSRLSFRRRASAAETYTHSRRTSQSITRANPSVSPSSSRGGSSTAKADPFDISSSRSGRPTLPVAMRTGAINNRRRWTRQRRHPVRPLDQGVTRFGSGDSIEQQPRWVPQQVAGPGRERRGVRPAYLPGESSTGDVEFDDPHRAPPFRVIRHAAKATVL